MVNTRTSVHPARRAFWMAQSHQWHWVSAALCLIGLLAFADRHHAQPRPIDRGAHATVGCARSVLGAARGMAYARAHAPAVLMLVRGADGLHQRQSPAFAAAVAR